MEDETLGAFVGNETDDAFSTWSEVLSDSVMIFDAQRRLTYVNPSTERLLGLPSSELLGWTIRELGEQGQGFFRYNATRAIAVDQVVGLGLAGRSLRDDETGVTLPDGTAGVLSWCMDPIRACGDVVGTVMVLRDTTVMANATFLTAPVGMVRIRGNGELLEVNRTFRAMLNLVGEQAVFRPFRELLHPGDISEFDRAFTELIEGGRDRYEAEHRFMPIGGGVLWCNVTMTVPHRRVLGDEQTWYDRVVGVVEDITTRKRLEAEVNARTAQLEVFSKTDSLTGLYNRRHLEERLAELASMTHRHNGELSVLIFDIDRFKLVNDTYGHEAGDQVIRTVADRLRSGGRAEDVIGRWGGEEFLVVAPLTDLCGAQALGERLRMLISSAPVKLPDNTDLPVTASAGVACGAANGISALLRRADAALYVAKGTGRDRLVADTAEDSCSSG